MNGVGDLWLFFRQHGRRGRFAKRRAEHTKVKREDGGCVVTSLTCLSIRFAYTVSEGHSHCLPGVSLAF